MDFAFERIVERDVAEGQHRNPDGRPEWFTTAFFHHPDELQDEVATAGFEDAAVFAVEGLGGFWSTLSGGLMTSKGERFCCARSDEWKPSPAYLARARIFSSLLTSDSRSGLLVARRLFASQHRRSRVKTSHPCNCQPASPATEHGDHAAVRSGRPPAVGPRLVLVVERAVAKAAVQDADQSVAESPESLVVRRALGPLLIVESARSR